MRSLDSRLVISGRTSASADTRWERRVDNCCWVRLIRSTSNDENQRFSGNVMGSGSNVISLDKFNSVELEELANMEESCVAVKEELLALNFVT